MSLPTSLPHIREYGIRQLDGVTLRHLLEGSQRRLGQNVAMREQMPSEAMKLEWDAATKAEDADDVEAILLIRAELKRREGEPQA